MTGRRIEDGESYNLQYGANYIAVMPTNLYGPNDNFHMENSHVMPAMMRKVYLAKLINDNNREAICKDLSIRPVGANIKENGETVRYVIDRNHSTGRGGAIPSLGEIRNCHINVGTGKELTIRELSQLVVKAVGFTGTVEFDSSKPDGTMRKLIDVSKLHSLGWTHKVEIEDGVRKLFDWYRGSLK